jgi:hypothetical protein
LQNYKNTSIYPNKNARILVFWLIISLLLHIWQAYLYSNEGVSKFKIQDSKLAVAMGFRLGFVEDERE